MQYIIKTTLRGIIRTTWGALTTLLAILSYCSFTNVSDVGGYTAVGEFTLAVLTLMLVIISAYMQGIGSFKKVR